MNRLPFGECRFVVSRGSVVRECRIALASRSFSSKPRTWRSLHRTCGLRQRGNCSALFQESAKPSSHRTTAFDLRWISWRIEVHAQQAARNDFDCIVGLKDASRQLKLNLNFQCLGSCHMVSARMVSRSEVTRSPQTPRRQNTSHGAQEAAERIRSAGRTSDGYNLFRAFSAPLELNR